MIEVETSTTWNFERLGLFFGQVLVSVFGFGYFLLSFF
jgi:hypothetical protein